MDLELWTQLSAAIRHVERRWENNPRDTHPTGRIVRVHLWSTLHDRPTRWACVPSHWVEGHRPESLPNQSTMSRRMRRGDFEQFLTRLGRRLDRTSGGSSKQMSRLVLRIVDGKPLELPNHTSDRDARWGRGVSRTSVGYKLHLLCGTEDKPMPDAFVITPLDRCEKRMAARMIRRVSASIGGSGYLLGDAHFDAGWLFDHCRRHGHQLVCPRAKPHTGLGHHYQAPDRIRAVAMLEPPANLSRFGPSLYANRTIVERKFSQLTCFGGGLGVCLPPWVRRIWRVRRWVFAKLLINAARIRIRQHIHA